MTTFELLRKDADYGFQELMTALEGVTEGQAWSVLPKGGSDYLHSDGSIQGIVLHIASGKWMNGSVCFKNSELRWHEVADQIETFEPSWPAALDYLERSHRYWMDSWAQISDIEELRPTNWKADRPIWQIVQIVSQHDSYHAGQIAVLRYACPESNIKPPSYAEDIRKYCPDLVAW